MTKSNETLAQVVDGPEQRGTELGTHAHHLQLAVLVLVGGSAAAMDVFGEQSGCRARSL
jgi:hypothetical protein